jgi:hypothetical protein
VDTDDPADPHPQTVKYMTTPLPACSGVLGLAVLSHPLAMVTPSASEDKSPMGLVS